MNLHVLIMAGGKGTRFWPESTSRRPKQYLQLFSERSLLQETLLRFDGLVPPERRFIVTVKEQQELALKESGEQIAPNGLIFEPMGKNTAPCILLALSNLMSRGVSKEDVVAIVPADHVILNHQGFKGVISKAHKLAHEQKKIVTIGIAPHFPHTGYGYIQQGVKLEDGVFGVARFKEKPDLKTASEYLKSGNYFWNAGMFVAPIEVLLQQFALHAPEIYAFFPRISDQHSYAQIAAESIDYAVMEKSTEVLVIEGRFDWNDLGSWDALESVLSPQAGNFFSKINGQHCLDSSGNIVYAPERFVSLINVKDLVVVVNNEAVMVFPKKDAQRIKEVVEHLKLLRSELL